MSSRSAGRRTKGRRRRERLVLPSAIEALASSSLFQEHDADVTDTHDGNLGEEEVESAMRKRDGRGGRAEEEE